MIPIIKNKIIFPHHITDVDYNFFNSDLKLNFFESINYDYRIGAPYFELIINYIGGTNVEFNLTLSDFYDNDLDVNKGIYKKYLENYIGINNIKVTDNHFLDNTLIFYNIDKDIISNDKLDEYEEYVKGTGLLDEMDKDLKIRSNDLLQKLKESIKPNDEFYRLV